MFATWTLISVYILRTGACCNIGYPTHHHQEVTQKAKFMGPTWGPHGSCRPGVGPMLAPWTLVSGYLSPRLYAHDSSLSRPIALTFRDVWFGDGFRWDSLYCNSPWLQFIGRCKLLPALSLSAGKWSSSLRLITKVCWEHTCSGKLLNIDSLIPGALLFY